MTNSSRVKRKTNELDIIIDTPKGSRNKYKFDEKRKLLKLGGILPVGSVFPFDFGFIPSTVGGDGDPLDVLILMDEPAFPGCLVSVRLIGVIKAKQTEEGKTNRNDRIVAVASDSITHDHVKSLDALNKNLIDQIEHFFVSYNQVKGKKFEVLSRGGPTEARKVIATASKARSGHRSRRGPTAREGSQGRK